MKLLTPRNIALACKGKLVMGPKAKEADLRLGTFRRKLRLQT